MTVEKKRGQRERYPTPAKKMAITFRVLQYVGYQKCGFWLVPLFGPKKAL